MLRCVSSLSFSGLLEEKILAAAEAGFSGIEIFREDIVGFPGPPEDVAALASEKRIDILSLQSLRDFEAVPGAERAWALTRAERFLDLTARIGSPMLVVCANTRADTIPDADRAAADLAALADLARTRGLRIGYEALATSAQVRSYVDAWTIVKKANRENLGLIINAVHSIAADADFGRLRDIDPQRIFLVHLADAPTARIDTRLLTQSFRLLPGQGNLPVHDLYGALAALNYRGPLSLEIFNDQSRALTPSAIARDGMRAFDLLDGTLKADRSPHSLVRDVAFVELACQGEDASQLERLLSQMGFVRTHLNRPGTIALYRQGRITLVVNQATAGLAHSFYLLQGLSVSAVGLRVEMEQFTKRTSLQSSKPGSEGQAKRTFDVPTIRGPGGAVFYLLDDDLDRQPFFDRDFTPVLGAAPSNALGNVDHFIQALVPNLFLSALLFYRSVFDFKSEEQHDVFDPHGMVRSRTVSNANGRVRMSLNSSLSHATTTQRFVEKSGFAAYHHFAFDCDDIFAYAATLDPRFAMKVPPNYYDDLMLRFNVSAELIDKLRRSNILYDRDSRGSYFQLYSRQLNGFFFEVVQRNGYTGLGAANAPVRMLAQSLDFETEHAFDL